MSILLVTFREKYSRCSGVKRTNDDYDSDTTLSANAAVLSQN